MAMNDQLELDLAASHEDAATAFREWLLSQPQPDWITESSDDE
jgi:hypothetical protein